MLWERMLAPPTYSVVGCEHKREVVAYESFAFRSKNRGFVTLASSHFDKETSPLQVTSLQYLRPFRADDFFM